MQPPFVICYSFFLFQARIRERRHAAERRLRGVQSQSKILVAERCEDVDRLMPRGVPPRAGVHPALVLTQADRRNDVLKRA